MTTAQRVHRVIVNELGIHDPNKVHDDVELAALEMDSLDTVEIVMALEEEFGVILRDEAVEAWRTVGDVVASMSASP